jgi:hypothetical protein
LIDYYAKRGVLKTVDGMAAIPAVAAAIDDHLGGEKTLSARRNAASGG